MDVKVQKAPEGLAVRAREGRNGRPQVTQEQAIYGLLHAIHYRAGLASDEIFNVLRDEAERGCSANLSMEFSKVEIQLRYAANAAQNIRELGVCFPNDPVEFDENGKWVPVKDAGTENR